MCESIILKNGKEVQSVRQFQTEFKVDATKYGFDGDSKVLDFCLCQIDLEAFFKKYKEREFYYDSGEWYEGRFYETDSIYIKHYLDKFTPPFRFFAPSGAIPPEECFVVDAENRTVHTLEIGEDKEAKLWCERLNKAVSEFLESGLGKLYTNTK
jgi:hypothetical protein